MQRLIQNFRYRPEIDGLRAVAVMAVVFYHAGLGVPGGYVGVDVFFVISGFLITSLIVKDLEAGKFSLAGFWERRIRRILPALVVVVLATLAAGWFLLLPDDYAALGDSAFYQSLCAANLYFWRDTGYFRGTAEVKPLLHTWSLAVEEQFYVFLPLLLTAFFAVPAFRRRSDLLSLFSVGISLSLMLSVYGVVYHQSASFYLLPTRAWELLLGCYVAMLPAVTLNRGLRETIAGVSITGILLPCFLYSQRTTFPGFAAVPPCLGAAVFIWATRVPTAGQSTSVFARLLSTRPVVFIGLISYSLYLWHWPLLAFSTYWAATPSPLVYRTAVVIVGFALAVLSWRFVETPFRERRLCASRRSVYAFGMMATITVIASGLMLNHADGFPQRLPAEAVQYASAETDLGFLSDLSTNDVLAGNLVPIGATTIGSPVQWLIWGDSHAMAAVPAFDAFLKTRRLAGEVATHSSTAPVLDYFLKSRDGLGAASPAFNEAVLAHVERCKIPNVALIARWSTYFDAFQPPGSPPFDASLVKTVHKIRQIGSRPWIMLEVPKQPFNVPRTLAQFVVRGQAIMPLCARPDQQDTGLGTDPGLVAKLRTAGATLLDPRANLLSHDGSHYRVADDDVVLYRDSHHLSPQGAVKTILPLLEKSLARKRALGHQTANPRTSGRKRALASGWPIPNAE